MLTTLGIFLWAQKIIRGVHVQYKEESPRVKRLFLFFLALDKAVFLVYVIMEPLRCLAWTGSLRLIPLAFRAWILQYSPESEGAQVINSEKLFAKKSRIDLISFWDVVTCHMKKKLNSFTVQPSNVFPPYLGNNGEMIPCIVTDEGGHLIASMDFPVIIWESLPIEE